MVERLEHPVPPELGLEYPRSSVLGEHPEPPRADESKSDPLSILNRLREFFKLFLQNGLNSEFAYTFGLKDA